MDRRHWMNWEEWFNYLDSNQYIMSMETVGNLDLVAAKERATNFINHPENYNSSTYELDKGIVDAVFLIKEKDVSEDHVKQYMGYFYEIKNRYEKNVAIQQETERKKESILDTVKDTWYVVERSEGVDQIHDALAFVQKEIETELNEIYNEMVVWWLKITTGWSTIFLKKEVSSAWVYWPRIKDNVKDYIESDNKNDLDVVQEKEYQAKANAKIWQHNILVLQSFIIKNFLRPLSKYKIANNQMKSPLEDFNINPYCLDMIKGDWREKSIKTSISSLLNSTYSRGYNWDENREFEGQIKKLLSAII